MQMIGRASCIWRKCQLWPSSQGLPSLKISLYILKSQNVSGGQLLHNTQPVTAQRNASCLEVVWSPPGEGLTLRMVQVASAGGHAQSTMLDSQKSG